MSRLLLLVASCLLAPANAASAEEQPIERKPQSRAEQIRQARLEKSGNLTPDFPDIWERRVDRALTEGVLATPAGWGVKFGGLIPGAGFGFGPRYSRPELWGERIKLDVSAVGTINKFYALESSVAFPRIAGRRFDALFLARRNDYPSIQYFGPGPRSSHSGQTNYRREDNLLHTRLGWRPDRRHLLLGFEGTLLRLNVGPGTSGSSPAADTVYGPEEAPGIDHQPRFTIAGPFALLDFRDRPLDPHRGGAYRVRYLHHSDRTLDRFSFRRHDAQAEHHFPFLNEKRVVAVYARTELSYADPGQQVPFYMQPALGGSDSLRGYTQFRFTDNNSISFTGEYRWEVFPFFDLALFADAGNVFARPGLIGFRNMQGGGGLGLRIKSRDALVLRIDVGASREGVRLWISTAGVFSH